MESRKIMFKNRNFSENKKKSIRLNKKKINSVILKKQFRRSK